MAPAAWAGPGPYSIDVVIGPAHPGVVDSYFFDINNSGQVAGYITEQVKGGYTRSVVSYQNGTAKVLASNTTAGFPFNSFVYSGFGINAGGDVVGNVADQLPTYFGTNGTAVPIAVPGQVASLLQLGYTTRGRVNDSGHVLISSFPNNPADTPPGAFSGMALWHAGGTVPLSALDPLYPYVNPPDPNDFNSGPSSSDFNSAVTRLNNANQFAAGVHHFAYDPKDPANPDDDVSSETFTKAYVYDGHGGYHILQSSTPGGEVVPLDIDRAGRTLGRSGGHLILWGPDGTLQSTLPDPGVALSEGESAAARNNLGQVVALTAAGGVLFYDPVTGSWSDLTPSIGGLGTGKFRSIGGFNDLGQFVGLVRPPQGGGEFGYVASPVPEPAFLATGAVAALALGRRRPARCRRP